MGICLCTYHFRKWQEDSYSIEYLDDMKVRTIHSPKNHCAECDGWAAPDDFLCESCRD